jgi:hypothetical protein
MTSVELGSVLQRILVVGCLLTAGKLLFSGLYRRYPIFFLYILLRIPNSIWPLYIDIRSVLYFNVWRATTVIVLIFYILMVVELYQLVLAKYRGLQTVGRWAMYGSLVISVTISVLSLLPRMASMSPRNRNFNVILMAERGVDTALALFIILILAFLSRYPIELNRNVRMHAVIFAAFFLSNNISLLMRGLFGIPLAETANLIVTVISTCTVYAWLLLLSPAGEEVRSGGHGKIGWEQERRLITQLETLNAAMLRVSRQQGR